jgi:hypothetical protein
MVEMFSDVVVRITIGIYYSIDMPTEVLVVLMKTLRNIQWDE